MTGYGFGEYAAEGLSVSVEIKGYNNRYLDINVNLPSALGGYEAMLRELVTAVCRRGRVDLYLRYHDSEETPTITFSPKTVHAVAEGLRQLSAAAGVSGEVRLEHLMRLDGVVGVERAEPDGRLEAGIKAAVAGAIGSFDEARTREGQAMYADIMENLKGIETAAQKISHIAPKIEEQITANLKERFTELLGQEADLTRVYGEVAVQLTKATISEELVRMESHIAAFRTIVEQRDSIGKKLDFLSQELNREINTIGSKNILADIGGLVVDAKDKIERIREQLRNVE